MRAPLVAALAALLLVGSASGYYDAARPIVKARSNKYRTLLSMDGGVFRGIIISSLLVGLEDVIKEVIVEKKLSPYTDKKDFDIVISDYFDFFSGTSAGGYLTTYFVTNGADIAQNYPANITARPGTSYGSLEMWLLLGNIFTSHWNPDAIDSLYNYTAQVQLGKAISGTLQSFFGNITLDSFDRINTGGLWAWTDMNSNEGVYLFTDPKSKDSGFVRPGQATFDGDAVFLNRNYYLWQAARGTGSAPTIVEPLYAVPTPDTPLEMQYNMTIGDGCIAAEVPTYLSIPHLIRYERWDPATTAVLSLGTCNIASDWSFETWMNVLMNPSAPGGWMPSWNFQCVANKAPAVQSANAIFNTDPKNPRHLRIDEQFSLAEDNSTACGVGVNASTCAYWKQAIIDSIPGAAIGAPYYYKNFQAYYDIGQYLYTQYRPELVNFVTKYVFGL